jgi:hypothetical protein
MRPATPDYLAIDQLGACCTWYCGAEVEECMALEQFRVQIAMLMDEITKAPEDVRSLQEALREKLAEMQALGLPLPDDLVNLEEYLEEGLEPATPRPRRKKPEPPAGDDL